MNTRLFYSVLISVTIIISSLIVWGILTTQWKTETIKMSLEKGQNPLYAMCAMDSQSELCKSMVTAMSLSGQFKDTSAPQPQSAASTPKK
jgi:hypothetical protein